MKINKTRMIVETNGRLNDAARILRALGFRLETRRGLSIRSEAFRGYFAALDSRGREWHIIG